MASVGEVGMIVLAPLLEAGAYTGGGMQGPPPLQNVYIPSCYAIDEHPKDASLVSAACRGSSAGRQ